MPNEDDILTQYPEQVWQVPARVLSRYNISEGDAILAGEYMVAAGLITVDTVRAYCQKHPEHAPDL